MAWMQWLTENWGDAAQTLGIVGSLLLATASFNYQARTQRVLSRFNQTMRHAELWRDFAARPELARVLDPLADIEKKAVTIQESTFVDSLINHLQSSFFAIKNGVLTRPEALTLDIKSFFSLPIPRAVWKKKRQYEDKDFIQFVENSIDAP